MKTNPNDSAFAYAVTETQSGEPGLTKREYFAAMAMQGMLANTIISQGYSTCEEKAKDAIAYADALITELNKETKLLNDEK